MTDESPMPAPVRIDATSPTLVTTQIDGDLLSQFPPDTAAHLIGNEIGCAVGNLLDVLKLPDNAPTLESLRTRGVKATITLETLT